MTAFVRLSNKKHLQHASRHAELHFSDGLCIMAHSPKAFLLTFHLLVRKSHYQHKMNFLKLEAYPLLARIRQLLPVRECQDFCVWGGYSRGSPTRLPFVFEMQYARPDAIAGAKVEGPARSAGGSSLAPAIARREAAGALAREV